MGNIEWTENINKDVFRIIQYLKNEYVFEYTFTEEELKLYGFQYPKMKWPQKPIIFASGEDENTLEVMAFGGCIGWIYLDGSKKNITKDQIEKLEKYIKFLKPLMEGETYFENKHAHSLYIPAKFVSDYSQIGEEITKILNGGYSMAEKLEDKRYLDLLVCAAYVCFMRRHLEEKKAGEEENKRKTLMLDVKERSMQSMIARENLNGYKNQNLVVIDVEFKEKISRKDTSGKLRKKNPSVDFVVWDKKEKSIGLIEFKYQGKSMEPGTKNDLKVHYDDFKIMIADKRESIVHRLLRHMCILLKYQIIDDAEVECAIKEICSTEKLREQLKLWCGFYFVNEKAKKTYRKEVGKNVLMEERIKYDCRAQIVDKCNSELEKNQVEVRYQQSDINDSRQILMEEDFWESVKRGE